MEYSFERSWTKPAIRLGQITVSTTIVACFLPNIYHAITYGVFPSLEEIGASLSILAMVFASSWIVQPITFSAVFGTAGTYMAVLAGSMSQIRIPASIAAQEVVGTESGSPKAEVVSVLGIAGSVIMSIVVLTVFILFGAGIMSVLPESISTALTTLIFPALFGAMFGSLLMSGWKIAILVFPVIELLALFSGMPDWALILISVFGSIIVMRLLYKNGYFSPKKDKKV